MIKTRNSQFLYKVSKNPAWKPGHDQSPAARKAAVENFKIFRLRGAVATACNCVANLQDRDTIVHLLVLEINRIKSAK